MQLTKPDSTILTIPAQVIREAIQTVGSYFVRLWSGDTSETIEVDQATHAKVVAFIERIDQTDLEMRAPEPAEPRRDSMDDFLQSLAPMIRQYFDQLVRSQEEWSERAKKATPITLPALQSASSSASVTFETSDGRTVATFLSNIACLVEATAQDGSKSNVVYLAGGRMSFNVEKQEADEIREGLFSGSTWAPTTEPAPAQE